MRWVKRLCRVKHVIPNDREVSAAAGNAGAIRLVRLPRLSRLTRLTTGLIARSTKAMLVTLLVVVSVVLAGCACSGGQSVVDAASSAREASVASSSDAAYAGSNSASSNSSSSSEYYGAQLPGTRVRVTDVSDLNALGLRMALPDAAASSVATAQAREYYLIDNKIGEVLFKLNGSDFIYRASASERDFSGVAMSFVPIGSYDAARSDSRIKIAVEQSDGGYLRATWDWQEGQYCLVANGNVPYEAFANIAIELAQAG